MLALPLLVPCLLLPLGLLHIEPPILERFISLAGLAAVVGGIPYALLALVFTAWLVYSAYALGFGYFYVAVASVIVWLARRIGAVGGIVRDERAPDAPEAER